MPSRLTGAAALAFCAAALSAFTLSACGTPTAGVPVAADPTGATGRAPTSAATVTSQPPASDCDYRRTPGDEPADGRDVGLPAGDAAPTTITLVTDKGEIPLTTDVEAAPCTVASIAHLAGSGFYDDSPCHRLTKAETLSVLQCGDPTGQGTGGPGYTIPNENPTDLEPSGQQDFVVYPRGTVAMANTSQPHSGGSQFFLVYADSVLPPTYAVFATIDEAGLAVLDQVTAEGVAGGGQDGAPATPVTIQKATTD